MPSPKNVGKKSPAATAAVAAAAAKKSNGNMEAKLAKRKSQEFKDKIKGWNQGGAGLVTHSENHEVVAGVDNATQDDGTSHAQEPMVVIEEEENGKECKAIEAAEADNIEEVMVEDEASDAKTVNDEIHEELTPDITKRSGTSNKRQTPQRKNSRDINLEKKAWVRRKSKPQVEADTELKHGVGAPKRRVVSDGHWRRDRLAKKEIPIKAEEDQSPKPTIVRRSVANVGLRVPVSVQEFVDDQAARAHEPESPSPPPSPLTELNETEWEKKETPDYESSGLKVYVKRRKRTKTVSVESRSALTVSETSFTATSSVEKPSSATDLTTPDLTPAKAKVGPQPASAPAAEEKLVQPMTPKGDSTPSKHPSRNKELDETTRPSARKRQRAPAAEIEASRHSAQSSKSRVRAAVEKFENTTPNATTSPAIPKIYGNRIEAWLGNMPDPFTDADEKKALTPEPLSVSSRSTKTRAIKENAIDSNLDIHKRSSEASRKSHPNLGIPDMTEKLASDASSTETPTLKRGTAGRHATSPVKGRTVSQDTMSGSSSRPASRRIPGGPRERQDSSRTHRLPRILSRETFDQAESVLTRNSDGDQPISSGLKRRLTKHSDLISVLSLPKDEAKAIRSARSIRTHRTSLRRATVGDLMHEITTDELKYQRELRTLVDGVIPVLLQCVLSGSESAQAAGLLGKLARHDSAITQPIVDMGVALERLRSAHRKIPMHEPEDLLKWGEKAMKPYEEYLRVWRMGFEDVIVNLAPAEETTVGARLPSWSEKAPKNERGDLVHGDGERVDVAYLLKRPLVRLKYLAKAFKGINQRSPSASADAMATTYNDLVGEARQRSNNERARLEDEAAARIDPTRARDPRSLAPITGVSIDPTRRVRARDLFDMELQHSSGQQLVCRIEVFMRDDAPDRGNASDLLFCEVSAQDRWLLFPPIPWHLVSARSGEQDGEVVLLIRGHLAAGKEWQEVMSVQASDEQSALEWVQMLGLEPRPPPSLSRKASFSTIAASVDDQNYMMAGGLTGLPRQDHSRPPSPSEVEVPIGERYEAASRKWDGSEVNSVIDESPSSGLRRMKARRYRTNPPSPLSSEIQTTNMWTDYPREQPRYKPQRYKGKDRPVSMQARSKSDWTSLSCTTTSQTASTISGSTTPTKKDYQVWLPSSERRSSSGSEDEENDSAVDTPRRPQMHRRTSSVPSMNLPNIPKLRKPDLQETPVERERTQRRADSSPERPSTAPDLAPAKTQQRRITPQKEEGMRSQKPSTSNQPKSSRPTSNGLGVKTNNLTSFTPAFLKKHRRSSSPLKHEYEPSTASESSSDSELSYSDDEESVTSESSAEAQDDFQSQRDDQVSTVGDLKAFRDFHTFKPLRQYQQRQQQPAHQQFPKKTPPASVWSASGPSLQPSDSASQGPYRRVPQTQEAGSKTVASLFCWAESGTWASLHPEECNIVVTPGLIEAFDLTQASTCKPPPGAPSDVSPSVCGIKPLIALELTPLVPLRRGTALDISIRSPCTENSLLRAGNNIMLRSRSPEECDALYNLINRARINNPTYIALQQARPYPRSNWAEAMERRNNDRVSGAGGSWWNPGSRKASTYRSSGSRPGSVAATDSSIGTMNTAFSALRRFSGGSRIFNIARSTITSINGNSHSTTSESLDSGTSTPSPPIDPSMGTPVGLSNVKIRLYIRETASKWRDLGSARMTIILPPRPDPSVPADPKTTGIEKRILVLGKTRGETLLDATLGESSFERVARTGIAVSIWEDDGTVGARGGVLSAKAKVYMVQMKSERDAAFTFNQVGKLRY